MKSENACYRCEKRNPGCHSVCESYAAFLEERAADREARKPDAGTMDFNRYAREKRKSLMDAAAKRGFRSPNYTKARYR